MTAHAQSHTTIQTLHQGGCFKQLADSTKKRVVAKLEQVF
jgi:hypothetical protein